MMPLPLPALREIIRAALHEDIGRGDLTADLVVPADAHGAAQVVLREPGVLAGGPLIAEVYAQLDARVSVSLLAEEGATLPAGAALAEVRGPARALLSGERVMLNLLQRLCGVATLTASYVAAVQGTKARILDTRKTTPGLRALEKYAVRCGGGVNHRFGLDDAVLVKDNHLAWVGGDVALAVRRVRAAVGPLVSIEVEADTLAQAVVAAEAGANVVLLDNMAVPLLRQAVAQLGGRVVLEASGGVSLATVGGIAATGVDYISVGALTHSARALDIGLDAVVY